jgi:two-component system, chemotaxis family, response regulator Rcp1
MSKQVLLVEDSPGDIRLMREALRDAGSALHLHVVNDGTEAIEFLNQRGSYANSPRPDIILLDLNLPKMDGRQVLSNIKNDASLKLIQAVILTTSADETDIHESYKNHVNCYLTKPVQLDAFENLMKDIDNFWFKRAKLSPTDAEPTDAHGADWLRQ